jgi:probable HAF family extracellular repeat protein
LRLQVAHTGFSLKICGPVCPLRSHPGFAGIVWADFLTIIIHLRIHTMKRFLESNAAGNLANQLCRLGVAAALINLSWSQGAIAASLYTLTDLGALTGGESSYATGINNNGQVVGQAASSAGFRAFLWSATGGMINLGTPVGSNFSYATGINDSGQVVGYATVGSTPIAFQWDSKTGMTALPIVANTSRSYAYAINEKGQIVGYADIGTDASTATRWQGQQSPAELGNRGLSSIATGVNNQGQVVGQIATVDGFRAVLWNAAGSMNNLGTLNGGNYSYATGINDKGQVVGYSTVGQSTANSSTFNGLLGNTINAFIWNSSTGMTSLGSLSAQDNSYATGINERGQVVGYSYGLDNGNYRYRAFMWNNGAMTDLNSLIDPALGWTLKVANAVNDNGLIVGYGQNAAGQSRAFLLTPQATKPNPVVEPAPTTPTQPIEQPQRPTVPPVTNPPTPAKPAVPDAKLPPVQPVPEASTGLGVILMGCVGLRRWLWR